MRFPDPLIPGRLIKRYKRFLADVELRDGDIVTAHCANPGSMMGLAEPGSQVWLSPARNPARKLRFSWEIASADGEPVGINTSLPNGIVADAIAAGAIPELTGYPDLKREVRYGKNSRIDILLSSAAEDSSPENAKRPCYVEVKNVTLKRGADLAEFPDSVTSRGAKHLEELGDAVEAGYRAVMFFLVQRSDCSRLGVAGDIDPNYEAAIQRALARGVETVCYDCKVTPEAVEINRALEINI
ncbi:DNA/RNA nuclease SfsA [Denitrobaculum tricleocarpae]|uniref:Sugar fermentation stimulation protein homolog n=1 Tax=Denitrobaculum tricleocarpae TaxID=2591009 RepID=A0A545T200_9PROT|nr:DNA/RNA nuclease SfsA [Denitrobaculum tricleocarpae]TQV71225.1 DNA/RNA nuclease SfsA [Denitrobaculum tricleocarpae]